ncbi:Inner membrane amino-acid ABC transporter permease protein YecS [Caulifigura coniformis]|uniref:Inner membrane amino-acid ABC transporter permease protein YecS n=1 Tax=Caulifigura coniformis TaxID=2527983 RepID=A0A517SMM5_9PLAN|nr:ABC transporter substrate-binding protein/permease [Caulifigura coniformis]QDT57365.1 Inner membrane amino-acid ABC transporter permease protein YecS [Caulifigura coniformis]
MISSFSVRLCVLRASVVLLLALVAIGAATAAEPLKWGADAEGGAPYIFLDPEDVSKTKGFEVDLAAALSKAIDRPIEFQQYPYDGLISGLNRGDIDLAMNGLEITPDRLEHVRFSRPYYVYTLQLTARADETRFQTVDDWLKLKLPVGTLSETAASRYCEKNGLPLSTYDGQVEPYQDLALGRLDAVLADLPAAVAYARSNPALKFIGDPIEPGYYAIALRPKDEELAKTIDAGLDSLIASGELRRIYEKWGIWNADQEGLQAARSADDFLKQSAAGFSMANVFSSLGKAAIVTIQISVCSMCLAMLLGLTIAICRLYGPMPIRVFAVVWVEFFRGIPVLLLLYVLYFGLPTILQALGLGMTFAPSNIVVAIIAFGLNYSAYEAEIYRAGITAVPQGQWEAAASLGMSKKLTFKRIILPQATRIILPPVTNDFVALFKDTSVASAIAVVELTKQYQMLAKSSLRYMEIGLATAILYLVMSIPLGYLARRLEARWGKSL